MVAGAAEARPPDGSRLGEEQIDIAQSAGMVESCLAIGATVDFDLWQGSDVGLNFGQEGRVGVHEQDSHGKPSLEIMRGGGY